MKKANRLVHAHSRHLAHDIKVIPFLVSTETVHRNDAGMFELGRDSRLANQSPLIRQRVDFIRFHALDGDDPGKFSIPPLEDFAKTSRGNKFSDSITRTGRRFFGGRDPDSRVGGRTLRRRRVGIRLHTLGVGPRYLIGIHRRITRENSSRVGINRGFQTRNIVSLSREHALTPSR